MAEPDLHTRLVDGRTITTTFGDPPETVIVIGGIERLLETWHTTDDARLGHFRHVREQTAMAV